MRERIVSKKWLAATASAAVGLLVFGACSGEIRAERNGKQYGEAVCDVKTADNADAAKRELNKVERRGGSARKRAVQRAKRTRNQVEREVKKARTQVEREVKARRRDAESTLKTNRGEAEKRVREVSERVRALV